MYSLASRRMAPVMHRFTSGTNFDGFPVPEPGTLALLGLGPARSRLDETQSELSPNAKREETTMSHRTLASLIVALVASSVLSPAAAQPAAVEVIIDSVTPGTPSGDGDWCIGDAEVELIAHVVDVASQSVVTEGQLWMQFCVARTLGALNGFAKEDCEATGPPRWLSISGHDLAAVNPADFTHNPGVLALGVRFQFRPASGGEFQRATSVPFNLDTTCGP